MVEKKKILLKLTGEVFLSNDGTFLSTERIKTITDQINRLSDKYQFGIVVGGGNILRGEKQGKQIGLTPSYGHQTGMLATIINGVILKDTFEQKGLCTCLLSSIFCPQVSEILSDQNIQTALRKNNTIIFVGGTGAPFFTTDTNAIIRGLQMGAAEVWKATGVDGVFDSDPEKNPDAKFLKKIKYSDAISKKLGILDMTAMVMAEKHNLNTRVFNIFKPDALVKTSESEDFGSLIHR